MSHFYLKSKWQATYANNIMPVNGEPLWQKSGRIPITVPKVQRMPGRPKKQNRVKDPHESPSKPGHITRHGRIFRCSICKQTGHNAKTCKSEPTHRPRISGEGASSSNASRSTNNAPRKRRQQGPSTTNVPPNTTTANYVEVNSIPTQSSQTKQSGLPLNTRRRILIGMSSTTIGTSTSRQHPFTIPRQLNLSNISHGNQSQ
ncbi:PREDICTED: uncharacterized protein LOC104821565 [Tarenaya hassleriana]|uniref:uncharacterized protein LOC104821565 n=1 Tax=Tarenaya hassleriana TaxID=28532 RepID=UPI0008FCE52C|nr:PREDICTED: uncharacterized protein LOC104821565 [Tarenaya hassleriana]